MKSYRFFTALILAVMFILSVKAEVGSTDIRESSQIGYEGGSITAEDPESGVTVSINFPKGALPEKTTVTLIIHSTPLPKVLAKTLMNGVSVLPEGLLLQEKAQLAVYNPPAEVNESMMLYRVVNQQFIIPLGDNETHVEENWIEGTLYAAGRFTVGTPTAAEALSQCRKLAEYNPAKPMAYAGEEKDISVKLLAGNGIYAFHGCGAPYPALPYDYVHAFSEGYMDDEECLRWQKALTKIEATMTWIEFHQRNGNTSAENAEKLNAERALQEAIDGYLNKASPVNRCGSYIRAAAKYLDAATMLGMNLGEESAIAQHFSKLVDECSFVFTVETYEWINNPRETHSDGATTEEKSDWYGTLKCHIPWKEFISSGTQTIKGEGNMNLHWTDHWVGSEKESHSETNGTWRSDKIEGTVTNYTDEYGQVFPQANITIYWTKKVTTHIWGHDANDSYDETGTDTQSYNESKSFPLKHGYEEKTGNDRAGRSVRVVILKQPDDKKDNPDECF